MLPIGSVVDRNRHIITETEIARFLRRETGREDLFTYRHALTGRWVVACWVNRLAGQFVELANYGSLKEFTSQDAHWFRRWARNQLPTGRDLIKQAILEENARRREEDDFAKEAGEHKRFLGRKVGDMGKGRWWSDSPGFPVSFGPM